MATFHLLACLEYQQLHCPTRQHCLLQLACLWRFLPAEWEIKETLWLWHAKVNWSFSISSLFWFITIMNLLSLSSSDYSHKSQGQWSLYDLTCHISIKPWPYRQAASASGQKGQKTAWRRSGAECCHTVHNMANDQVICTYASRFGTHIQFLRASYSLALLHLCVWKYF